MRDFTHFACIDWSGAAMERPPGIAVAQMPKNIRPNGHSGNHSDGSPALIAPPSHNDPSSKANAKPPNPKYWSRENVLHWLLKHADNQTDILIGMDFSFSFPFFDKGCFFPEWEASDNLITNKQGLNNNIIDIGTKPPIAIGPNMPRDARELWRMIDDICAQDAHMGVHSFLSHQQGQRHFRHSKDHIGDLFDGGIGRLRHVEHHQRHTKQANSWSCFNLVGAGQVGKGSLTGMRLLHQLNGAIPIWPFDPIPDKGPVLIEIYTTMAARAAGVPAGRSKIRDRDSLNQALKNLDCPAPPPLKNYNDHATDAILTAAWLQKIHKNNQFWYPNVISSQNMQIEGWTFGVI